jgi:hypothetical protein
LPLAIATVEAVSLTVSFATATVEAVSLTVSFATATVEAVSLTVSFATAGRSPTGRMPTGNGPRTKTDEAPELLEEPLFEEPALLRSLLCFAAAADCSGVKTVEGCIAAMEIEGEDKGRRPRGVEVRALTSRNSYG